VIRKIMGDGTLQDPKPGESIKSITAWLEENDYKQTGALVKREGDGPNEGEWAAIYLRPWDGPDLLSGVMGAKVVGATLAYYPADDMIDVSRRRGDILRDRYAQPGSTRDFGVTELPLLAERNRAYGLAD
jgi:hypothetical protein